MTADQSALLFRLHAFIKRYDNEGVGLEIPADMWKKLREDIAAAIKIIAEHNS